MNIQTTLRCFTFCLLVIEISCQQQNASLSDIERENITKEIRTTLNNYYTDIKVNGLMAEFNYLDSSSSFFWVPPGATTSLSHDSISKILSQNAVLYKSIENLWDTLDIRPVNNELAVYTGRIQSVATDTSGVSTTSKLVETGVMIRRKTGWKLLSGQTSVVSD